MKIINRLLVVSVCGVLLNSTFAESTNIKEDLSSANIETQKLDDNSKAKASEVLTLTNTPPLPPNATDAPSSFQRNIQRNVIYIDPVTTNVVRKVPIYDIPLDDGLNFNFIDYESSASASAQITNAGSRIMGFLPPFDIKTGGGIKVTVPDFQGGFAQVYYSPTTTPNIGYSTQHLYASDFGNYSPTIYFPNGEKLVKEFNSNSMTLYSPHGISSVKYVFPYSGYQSHINVSNGYNVTLTFDTMKGTCIQWRIVNRQRDCLKWTMLQHLMKVNDNHDATWVREFVDTGVYYDTLIRPDGLNFFNPNGQQYTYTNSPTLGYGGTDVAYPYQVSVAKSGNTTIVTHADGSKWIYTMLPESSPGIGVKNQEGLYGKLVKQDKNSKVFYEENNTWGLENDIVPVLEKQVITQDGVTTTTQNSDFNQFMYPQTIIKTASDGSQTTTKTTYFILNNTDKGWHMVKPETITVTAGADGKGKVLSSIVNAYNTTDGTLTSQTMNGVKTSYTYDDKYNLATVTDTNGGTWTYSDYISGQPQIITDPNGNVTKYTYNYLGEVTSKTDPLGNTTKYTYNIMGYLTSIIPPAGNATTVTYSNDNRTITETTGQYVKIYNYDALGNLLNVTESDGANNIVTAHITDPLTNQSFSSY